MFYHTVLLDFKTFSTDFSACRIAYVCIFVIFNLNQTSNQSVFERTLNSSNRIICVNSVHVYAVNVR